MLLVIQIFTFVGTALGENESTEAMFFVVLELPSVSIAARECNGAIAVHLVIQPVALVDATFRIARYAVTMAFTTPLVTFVTQIWHFAEKCD